MSEFAVSGGTESDLDALIDLARSVESLFGPMIGHGFEDILRTNIERGSLFVVRNPEEKPGTVVGGIIFDERDAPDYHVSWLAIREAYRGRGGGKLLLSHALARVTPPCRVEVATFGADNAAGLPARRLYEAFGFRPGERLERGPEGGSRQRFTLLLDG